MCGICGVLNSSRQAVDQQLIERMMKPLEPRGPDDGGFSLDHELGFGHRRLSIIDLSSRSHQPMVDADTGLRIVFNGTIYNYPELRQELQQRGHQFRSSGDTEVILKAFAEWGEHCVARLTGMFAFAIWNQESRRLFVARDRMGIKPLYYSHNASGFMFASDTRSLLASGRVDKAFDAVGLHHHLTLHAVVPAPRTIFRDIRKVRPAHYMWVESDGAVTEHRYWTLNARRPSRQLSEPEWLEGVHAALKEAVRRRMEIADVPVGVLLSGGLDSSLLVGLLHHAGVQDLKTFTVGFSDQPEEAGNEFEYSDPVARQYGTDHHRFLVPDGDLLTRLPEAIDAMSEPIVGQDAIGFYLLSEQVAKHVKVVQSGQGADEVFGGYFWYPEMHAAEHESDLHRFASRYFDRPHQDWLDTMDPSLHLDHDPTSALVSELLAESAGEEYLDKVLHMDVTTLIVDDPVKRVDNMTMAWGLEARVPFLDHELVEFAASMPPELKIGGDGKYALKAISRGIVPDAVIDRKKGYFPVPALKYVRGEFLDYMSDALNSTACRGRGLFQRREVDRLLSEPDQHFTQLQGSKLWHLALLELWLQSHVDGVSTRA
ncbi:MAG: N-acetylglutaminylglutamine amidotransferase [Gammaproteobacteria bacterium]|nr:N-acetylglutaminylglutamine amidotransferase [Gammaproteobacteria bacterium]